MPLRLALRPLFWLMARRYRPSVYPGFRGIVVYELTTERFGSAVFTIDIFDSRARASAGPPGAVGSPAATLRAPLRDFLEVGLGRIDPAEPLLNGRATGSGDLSLMSMLPEMFGARPPR